MLDHVFHTNIIAYCQQNRYVRLAIYTDIFTLMLKLTMFMKILLMLLKKDLIHQIMRLIDQCLLEKTKKSY